MKAEDRKNFRGGDPVKGKTLSKHWFKVRSDLACWEQRWRTMVYRQPSEVWGQGIVWVTSWKLKLRLWHYIEWPETQNLNYYKWLPSLSGRKKKRAPGDLNRNLKKIKFERPWNEEKKKINRKESCEIKRSSSSIQYRKKHAKLNSKWFSTTMKI